jgi:hypothetical protein
MEVAEMNRKPSFALATFVLLVLSLLSSACQFGGGDQEVTPQATALVTFRGVVRTGAGLGEVKSFCPDGLYLVAEEGYLTGQTSMLLLRVMDASGQAVMLSDPQFVGKPVEVAGKYPAQEVFCEALICQCEDYILVDKIDFR